MNLFTPVEVAKKYITIGKAKVNMPISKMFLLAVLAGAFIAVGGVSVTTAAVSIPLASIGKFAGACVFPGGLTMALLAGSELFTGNMLLVIPLLEKEISPAGMLKSWIVMYIGNFVGGCLIAAGIVYSHQISLFGNQMAVSVLSAATAKCTMPFMDAVIKGILCNFLVCIAVWISFAAKDVAGKIMGLFFPIMMFVLCGFEHSVANMYYISAGLFAKGIPEYASAAAEAGVDLQALTWGGFFGGRPSARHARGWDNGFVHPPKPVRSGSNIPQQSRGRASGLCRKPGRISWRKRLRHNGLSVRTEHL